MRIVDQRVLPKKNGNGWKFLHLVEFFGKIFPRFLLFSFFFFPPRRCLEIYSTTRGGDGHREDLEEVE